MNTQQLLDNEKEVRHIDAAVIDIVFQPTSPATYMQRFLPAVTKA